MDTRWTIPGSQQRTQHDDGQWLVFDEASGEIWQVTRGVADVLESLNEGWQPGEPLPPRLQPYDLAPAGAAELVADLARQGLVVDTSGAPAVAQPRHRTGLTFRRSVWQAPALSAAQWRMTVMALAAAAVASVAILWIEFRVFPGQGRMEFLMQSLRDALLEPAGSKKSVVEIIFYWVLLAAVHELAHAFALTSRTGKPAEVGLSFMFGWPRPFANVTALVTLARRSERISVLLAGPFAEFGAWLVLLAAFRDRLGTLGLLFALLGPVRLLANLVPFIRNDGYLTLQELTGDRDLMRTARRAAYIAFLAPGQRPGCTTRWWLPWYGLLELSILPALLVPLGLALGGLASYPSGGTMGGLAAGVGLLVLRVRGIDAAAEDWLGAHAA